MSIHLSTIPYWAMKSCQPGFISTKATDSDAECVRAPSLPGLVVFDKKCSILEVAYNFGRTERSQDDLRFVAALQRSSDGVNMIAWCT